MVDDEARVLRFVKVSLSIAGYDAITTTSGEESLQLIASAKPDIVLLDIFMAPLTGFDVLQRLRPHSQIPVIVFSARSDMADLAHQKGANGFLPKPFLPEQLVRKVRDVLESRQTGTEAALTSKAQPDDRALVQTKPPSAPMSAT